MMFVNILDGVKVVDVTAWAFVPSAGGVMAHWGADVVKVESTTAPDPMRGGNLEPGRSGGAFKHYSRGKKSVAINLATPEGQDLLYRLVADADVFLTSYLPATRRKLRIDVEDIRAVNPNIIYARGSGYGPKGPESGRPGYDGITWWYRGALAESSIGAARAEWPPDMVGHGDGISGLVFAGGICAALLQRERTGVASVVDSSLLGTAVWFQGMALIRAQAGEEPTRKFGPAKRPAARGAYPGVSRALMSTYQTKDYRFLSLCFLGDSDRDYVDLCEHLGLPDLASDGRFVHSKERVANSDELLAILEETFASKTLTEWNGILVTAKGAWCAGNTPEEVFDDPQVLANGFVRYVDYPGGGVKLPIPPILFDEEGGDPPVAPDFAQHTDQVLTGLGCSTEDIARLRAGGVVV
jgi:crotonobetainyl-CoA:carnitine CoA-transferase CaiB-like acyl-CoA transferase